MGGAANATMVALGPVRTLHVEAEDFTAQPARSADLREAVQALVDVRARSHAIVELMVHDPVLRQLGRDDLERLVQSGRIERFAEGTRVLAAGDSLVDLFLLLSGGVEVVAGRSGLAPDMVTRFGPGTLIGQVALLLDVPRTADVVARTPIEWLRIRGSTFMELVHRQPPLQRRLYVDLAGLTSTRRPLRMPGSARGSSWCGPTVAGRGRLPRRMRSPPSDGQRGPSSSSTSMAVAQRLGSAWSCNTMSSSASRSGDCACPLPGGYGSCGPATGRRRDVSWTLSPLGAARTTPWW